MTVVSEKTKQLAAKAADEVERRGLHKGGFYNSAQLPEDWGADESYDRETFATFATCEVCAWGALNIADRGLPFGSTEAVHVARREIREFTPFGTPLDEYNDMAETTAADIVALFRQVAAS